MKFTERTGLNLFEVNETVLKAWDEQDLFHKSMSEREGCPSFVFFEGPPLRTCFAVIRQCRVSR